MTTLSSLAVDWSTIVDASLARSGPPPADEWWFSLEPDDSDAARMAKIQRSMQRYEERFGCPPADLPRVVMIGKTPVLAYATPVTKPAMLPMTVIIEEPTEHIMQLMLL